jgi:hypothetical protein
MVGVPIVDVRELQRDGVEAVLERLHQVLDVGRGEVELAAVVVERPDRQDLLNARSCAPARWVRNGLLGCGR